MPRNTSLSRLSTLLFACCATLGTANAASVTLPGMFTADNSTFDYTFTNTSSQNYSFYTTSYGGGTNADGSHTSAGGFVPVLTLFSPTGSPLAFGGGDATCHGTSSADPKTGLCEDANFSQLLAPGTYNLVLSEFPNVPLGGLTDAFLADGDAHYTGTNCLNPGGTFLQTDVSPCVQRTSSYTVNVTSSSASPVPEPPTWLLIAPSALAIGLLTRRQLV